MANEPNIRVNIGSSNGGGFNSGGFVAPPRQYPPHQYPQRSNDLTPWSDGGPPGEKQGMSQHERKIDSLRDEAISLGAEVGEVDEVIKRAFFDAAKEDKNDRWVLEQVRPKLRAMIAKLRYEVEYSQDEDSAHMSVEEFVEHVHPRPDLYTSWQDAAAEEVREGLEPLLERIQDLRRGDPPHLVVVETHSEQSKSGAIYQSEDLSEVVACIFAQVDVRFQVRISKRAKQEMGNAYSGVLKQMMEPAKPDEVLKNEFLRLSRRS